MRILIAPDKFKGSLSAEEAAEQMAAGIREVLPDAEVRCVAIADGGEGTARVICAAGDGEAQSCEVHDALGRMVTARYCALESGRTAVMEMSEASGLGRLALSERDPVRASTLGTGEMLLDAARRGAREIIIGLGGSATNDGGYGMGRALGFTFLDHRGQEIGPAVTELCRLQRIIPPDDLRLPKKITAAVDVRTPLLGERGATRIFGAQKGVTPGTEGLLETALTRLADVSGGAGSEVPGAGAAGGLGFGLMIFCGAEIRPGFEVVAERIELREKIAGHDVVITGEGSLDAQTLEGKGPAGVAELARAAGKKVYAIAGRSDHSPETERLFDRVFVLAGNRISAAQAMANAAELVRARAGELARTL